MKKRFDYMIKVCFGFVTVWFILLCILVSICSCKTAPDWHTLPMAYSKAHLKTVNNIKHQKYCHFPSLYEQKYIKKTK